MENNWAPHCIIYILYYIQKSRGGGGGSGGGGVGGGAGGGDGEEMGVDAVRSRDGGDVNDVFKVGSIGSGVDRRRLSHGGFGQTSHAGERITTRT